MPGKNERQGRSTNIFFFHEGSLQGHGTLLRPARDVCIWAYVRVDRISNAGIADIRSTPIWIERNLSPKGMT